MYGHQSGYYPLSSLQLISKHARKTERDQETWELNNIKLSRYSSGERQRDLTPDQITEHQ